MAGALLIISCVQVDILRCNKLNAQHLDQHLLLVIFSHRLMDQQRKER